jgi:hypothetical protein
MTLFRGLKKVRAEARPLPLLMIFRGIEREFDPKRRVRKQPCRRSLPSEPAEGTTFTSGYLGPRDDVEPGECLVSQLKFKAE